VFFRINDGKARKIAGALRLPSEVFDGPTTLAGLPFLSAVEQPAEPSAVEQPAAAVVEPTVELVLHWADKLGMKPSLEGFASSELWAELARREKEGFSAEELAAAVEQLKAAYSTLAEFSAETGLKVATWNGAAAALLAGKVQV
jgi:hypothetical protein